MALATQTFPGAGVVELPAGAALAPTGIPDVPVFVGPAPRGIFTPTLISASDIATLVADYGCGPTVKEAAIAASEVAQAFVFLRTPVVSVAGTFPGTASTVRNGSSNFGLALTGTTTDGADVLITFSLGGTTGTGPITYNVSLDGGATNGGPISLGTALVIVVLGVTLTLATGHTVTTSDVVSWLQTAPSASVLTTHATQAGSSVITVAGTPNDAYEVAWKCVDDGAAGAGTTIGVAGIKFQYSLDYKAAVPTWTPTTSLSTANTLLLLDGPVSTESTGLTLNFGAGTIKTGDLFTFDTSLPAYDSAGITSALTTLANSNIEWTWIRCVGPVTESVGAAIDAIALGWDASGATSAKPSWGVVDMIDRQTTEPLAAWSARRDAEWTPYNSTRVGAAKGRARVSCPINGRNNRRSAMAVCMGRAMGALGADISTDWGEFDLGALKASVTLLDVNNATVEYDANKDQTGVTQGAIALRSWPGTTGVYPAGACLMGPSTDIHRIPLRRIMNVAKILELAGQKGSILRKLLFWTKAALGKNTDGFKVGDIFEPQAAAFDASMNAQLKAAITSNGWASSISYRLNRTPVALGGGAYKTNGVLQMVAIGFIVRADGTAQYVSAAT